MVGLAPVGGRASYNAPHMPFEAPKGHPFEQYDKEFEGLTDASNMEVSMVRGRGS